MSKWTPGPWEYETDMVGGGWESDTLKISIHAGKALIATYETSYFEYPDDEECKSNARLIAAAPELVEALERVCNQYESVRAAEGYPTAQSESTKDARALLARIKGEE